MKDTAPQTSMEAASQLHRLSEELTETRRTAARLRAAHDDSESLYKRRLWRVLAAGVDGRNGEEREAKAMTTPLVGEVRAEAAEIADRVGIKGWQPDTIADLRWLRDRSEGIAEAARDACYDRRTALQSWTSVVSWAKAEYEQTMRGAA